VPTDVKFRSSRVAPPPEGCPLTECMSFLGGAWTPNVLWYLREGPRRFNELRRDIVGVSAKVLSQRLQRLQADGMVERRVMPTSPPTVEYELTDLGREILPAVDAIVEVGHRLKDRRAETAKRRPGRGAVVRGLPKNSLADLAAVKGG
jgi:DNA-binding HxlR family transcriptional regulator